jgi:virulence factor Mce-like protein
MRTRAVQAALVAVLIAAAVLITRGGGGASYRAGAIFDSAKGIVPGQLVKIAGARVGTISSVTLEPGPAALIEFSVPRRFAPFHADASCQILPEGLISENYVQCDPGSRSRPALGPADRDGVPTVPLAHTTVPVSLQDVLNIFSLPVDERLSALIGELGIGTAGQGSDINAILQRANPALAQGDRVLSILDAQNGAIATAVTQTNDVLRQLASRSASVRSFVDRAAAVAGTTAAHSGALGAAVAQLPPFLRELRTNLVPIDRVVSDGGPLLSELRAAAPGLSELTRTLPAFTRPGVPAVHSLGAAASEGETTITAATPVVDQLAKLSFTAPPVLKLLDDLLVSTRNSGAFEGLLRLIYSFATDASGYDSTSHYITALIIPFPTCIADPTGAGCTHAYDSPGQGSIPINDPSAGPQKTSAAITPLLDYLLKK